MESSVPCDLSGRLSKARGGECVWSGPHLTIRPCSLLALRPHLWTLSSRSDPHPRSSIPFSSPITAWQMEPARRRSIIVPHLFLFFPPSSPPLSLFPLPSQFQDIPSYPLCVPPPPPPSVLMVSCFSLRGALYLSALACFPYNLISFRLLSYCTVSYCLCHHFSFCSFLLTLSLYKPV